MADHFLKMHGLGNDFVIIDAREVPVAMSPARAHAIADRRQGIGCDQLILLEPSQRADVRMRIFNADGSEVEACGNATRCVAAILGGPARIETLGGMLTVSNTDAGAEVTMAMDTRDMPVGWGAMERPMAVNVGNPHVVFFVPDCDLVPLAELGPVIEADPLFPARVNVNVASVTGPASLKLRVWERGVGLTQACGTGACATAVAAISSGRVTSPVTVALPGGQLIIRWALGEPIYMSGPATHVFRGETDWSRFG
jgi:diaminopimelate epimerase